MALPLIETTQPDVLMAYEMNGEPLTAGEADPQLAAIAATRELFDRSHQLEEGDTVTLSFLRDGHEHEVNLIAKKVAFAPRLMAGALAPPDLDGSRLPRVAWAPSEAWFIPRGWLDMELAAVNPELGEYFGTDTGVLVVRGPSEKESIGLASGDVILEIGDRAVTSPEHAMRILRSYEPEEQMTLEINLRQFRNDMLSGLGKEDVETLALQHVFEIGRAS